MIDARDLRIGNWVIVNDGENPKHNIQVHLVELEGINDTYDRLGWRSHYISSELEPIPLTEDLLLKCGFEKSDEKDTYGGYLLKIFDKNSYKIRIRLVEGGWYNNFYGHEIELNHIHTLQNFIYAISCKELKIEL